MLRLKIQEEEKEEAIITKIKHTRYKCIPSVFSIFDLNLKVVAEGVETDEQLALLKEKNCDYTQGYYYSKPISAEEIEKLFLKKEL